MVFPYRYSKACENKKTKSAVQRPVVSHCKKKERKRKKKDFFCEHSFSMFFMVAVPDILFVPSGVGKDEK